MVHLGWTCSGVETIPCEWFRKIVLFPHTGRRGSSNQEGSPPKSKEAPISTQTTSRKFSPRIRTWTLRDSVTASQFQSAFNVKTTTAAAAVATTAGAYADTANHIESAWSKLKGPLLDATKSAVSLRTTSGDLKPVVELTGGRSHQEKCARFKAYNAVRKGGKMTEETITAYIDTKSVAKHAVWLAKSEAEKEQFATASPDGNGVFHIAKQMDHTNQDVVGENCVHNDAGELAFADEIKMKAWVTIAWALCQTAQYRVLVAKQWAFWSPSTAELWLKWMSTAPCLVWKPPSARRCVTWRKFRKLLPILTTRQL